jgi:hypothetical protein
MRRLFIVAFALLFVLGCRDTDSGVQIIGNSQPSDDCEWDTATTLVAGTWDLSARLSYVMGPILGSLLVSRSLDTQAESNTVTITEFEVELMSSDGELLPTGNEPNPYTVATSLVLPVSEGGDAQLGVAVAAVVPSSYAPYVAQLTDQTGRGELLINVQASGSTAGGLSIKTVEYPWVVSLCAGCLEDCADDATEGCIAGQDGTAWCDTPAPAM